MAEENKQEETPVEEQDQVQEEQSSEEELDYNAIADEIEKLRKENAELKKKTESFKKKEEDGRERLKRILMGREQASSADFVQEKEHDPSPIAPKEIPEDYFTREIEF